MNNTSQRIVLAIAVILLPSLVFAQKDAALSPMAVTPGVEIVPVSGEPELHVDGVPFLVHAAQFDYFRVPPDLWARSLDRYSDLGINTIDIQIPWNWHEPNDGEFDFDGHTNPRRNLRGLLREITLMHFKLIVRPGPLIGGHWRNAGYPDWLLNYSSFKMSASEIQKGLGPPSASLAATDADAAAHTRLANDLEMSYERRWLTALAVELAPYSAKNKITIPEPTDRTGEPQQQIISGPLLFVALDDTVSVRPDSPSLDLTRYFAELRGALLRGGLDTLLFVTAADAAGQGLPSPARISASDSSSRISVAGQWSFEPGPTQFGTRTVSTGANSSRDIRLTPADAWSLSFLAGSLSEQPNFLPFVSGFVTTPAAPTEDIRAAHSSPQNMELASRVLLGSGVRAMTYSSLQDTLTPAGWGTVSTVRYFSSDAPFDLAGNRRSSAIGVERNGQLVSAWGEMLASSHVRADFGIVDLRVSADKTNGPSNLRYTQETEKLFRIARMGGYSPELVNPGEQSAERLARDRVIVVATPADSNIQLSDKAQATLVEFVKIGGTLVYFPVRPKGALLEPLWQKSGEGSQAEGARATQNSAAGEMNEWTFERGRVVAGGDFYTLIGLELSPHEAGTHPSSLRSIQALNALLKSSGATHGVMRSGPDVENENVFTSELVRNEATDSQARARPCADGQLCAAALVSVSNLSANQLFVESLEIGDPHASAQQPISETSGNTKSISLSISIPARTSLMLPIHAPLCSAAALGDRCADEVVAAGAELLRAERDGKNLELTFYVPARATVRLRLESEPSKIDLDEDLRLEDKWNTETGELEVVVPRGAAPNYRRVLRFHLRYTPHVTEKADREKLERKKNNLRGTEYDVFDDVRFPLGANAAISTFPPLIVADANSGGSIVISSQKHTDDIRSSDYSIDGPFRGAGSAMMFSDMQQFTRVRFQPSRNNVPSDTSGLPTPEGLLRGSVAIRSEHKQIGGPIFFLTPKDGGYSHYRYDFERDGNSDWVLESNRLRLIVSSAEGGRALALVDKSTSDNLINLDGALHDLIVAEGTPPQQVGTSGDFSLNRAYHAEWADEQQGAGLRLSFQEHKKSPAGIHVDKTLRFAAPETVEASYRISVVAPSSSTNTTGESKMNFISALSVPVSEAEEEVTKFCWQGIGSSATGVQPPSRSGIPAVHCEDFIASGEPISLPPEASRVEVRYPGRSTLAIEWAVGHFVIIPKAFSAQLNLIVPFATSSPAPSEFTLRYTLSGVR